MFVLCMHVPVLCTRSTAWAEAVRPSPLELRSSSSEEQSVREKGAHQLLCLRELTTRRLQYPLIKEYTLNQIRDPTIVYIRCIP